MSASALAILHALVGARELPDSVRSKAAKLLLPDMRQENERLRVLLGKREVEDICRRPPGEFLKREIGEN